MGFEVYTNLRTQDGYGPTQFVKPKLQAIFLAVKLASARSSLLSYSKHGRVACSLFLIATLFV